MCFSAELFINRKKMSSVLCIIRLNIVNVGDFIVVYTVGNFHYNIKSKNNCRRGSLVNLGT